LEQANEFVETLQSEFTAIMTRCPELYFIDLEFFENIPFVMEKNSELLKRSGWVVSYTRMLKEILSERNKRIDMATSTNNTSDLQLVGEQIRIQAHIADGEVINSLLLFRQFIYIRKQLEKIIKIYPEKLGKRFVPGFPAALAGTMRDLRLIAEVVARGFPPPELGEEEFEASDEAASTHP
jgi:hypothetical protein